MTFIELAASKNAALNLDTFYRIKIGDGRYSFLQHTDSPLF